MSKDRKERKTASPDRPDPASREEGLLGRWSRRKTLARARQQHEEKEGVGPVEERATDRPLRADATSPAEEKTDADMPPVETLDENSDYSAFLSPKVSDKLRRLALRKLFHLPAFNIRDGLDDYDEDYRTFEVLGDIMTADRRHRMELEKEKLRQRLAEEEAAEPAEAQGAEPAGAQAAEPEKDAEQIGVAASDEAPTEDAADEAAKSADADEDTGSAKT